ncbi:MAG: SigE family RNA polymerase sigma factor [Phycicoccus sp.]
MTHEAGRQVTTPDPDFEAFAEVAITRLRPLAHALAREPHRADDLVQITLERMYVAWPRVRRAVDDPLAYARTVLVRALISEQRRAWRSREVLDGRFDAESCREGVRDVPADDESLTWATRLDLRQALARLPARQRTAVVLRHLEDLSVEVVADLMGCATGTVKSTTSAGLAALRTHLDPLTDGAPR